MTCELWLKKHSDLSSGTVSQQQEINVSSCLKYNHLNITFTYFYYFYVTDCENGHPVVIGEVWLSDSVSFLKGFRSNVCHKNLLAIVAEKVSFRKGKSK